MSVEAEWVPRRGDWVVYAPGYKEPEIGRVWSHNLWANTCSVCYSHGCTAAVTPCELLRRYDPELFPGLSPDPRLGFHRFDAECPEYDEACCGDCRTVAAPRAGGGYRDWREL